MKELSNEKKYVKKKMSYSMETRLSQMLLQKEAAVNSVMWASNFLQSICKNLLLQQVTRVDFAASIKQVL